MIPLAGSQASRSNSGAFQSNVERNDGAAALPSLAALQSRTDRSLGAAKAFTAIRTAFDGSRPFSAGIADGLPKESDPRPSSLRLGRDLAWRDTHDAEAVPIPARDLTPQDETRPDLSLRAGRFAVRVVTRGLHIADAIAGWRIWDSKTFQLLTPIGLAANITILWHFALIPAAMHATLLPVAIVAVSLIASILLHESGHLWAVQHYGDPTPRRAGRTSLNPLHSIDLFGTILLPALTMTVSSVLFGFPLVYGWAKPIPVDFNRLRNTKTDPGKIAAAGLLVSLGTAVIAGTLWFLLPWAGIIAAGGTVAFGLKTFALMNFMLTAFNLIPFPWHDGGKIRVALMSDAAYRKHKKHSHLHGPYQELMERFWQGPGRMLSRYDITTPRQIDVIAKISSLGALGVLYAVLYAAASFPFLFLVLPCGGYDYWCIREKVRSQKAVDEMEDLASGWAIALHQISKDLKVHDNIDLREAEFSVVDAADFLLAELMAKEEFRKLSEDEKVAEFMKLFPERLFDQVKKRVFKGISDEKIRQVLADPRNESYVTWLKRWLTTKWPDDDTQQEKDIWEQMRTQQEEGEIHDTFEHLRREAGGDGN